MLESPARLCSAGSACQCFTTLCYEVLKMLRVTRLQFHLKMLFLTRLKIFVLHVLCSEVLKMFYVVCDKAAAPL